MGGLEADWVGESGGEVVPGSLSRDRFVLVGAGVSPVTMRSWGGASVDPEGDVAGEEGIWGRLAALTGLRMHRLTCRLRLDATPKRRPQVSHTNAVERGSAWTQWVRGRERTFFAGVDEEVLVRGVSGRVFKRCEGRTFLSVDGLSKDFSHIQQPCFFSRGRGPAPSCLDAREFAVRELFAQALRMD